MANQDGTLTDAEKQAIIKWMLEHEKQGMPPHCAFCRTNKWTVGDHIIDSPVRIPGSVVLGGTVYSHVMLICSHCGFTMMFNAVVMGILAQEEKADPASDVKEAAQ